MADDEIASFCAVTGADDDVAHQMLEATGNDLESAINLYFAAGAPGVSAPGARTEPEQAFDDEALARHLHECAGLIGGGAI